MPQGRRLQDTRADAEDAGPRPKPGTRATVSFADAGNLWLAQQIPSKATSRNSVRISPRLFDAVQAYLFSPSSPTTAWPLVDRAYSPNRTRSKCHPAGEVSSHSMPPISNRQNIRTPHLPRRLPKKSVYLRFVSAARTTFSGSTRSAALSTPTYALFPASRKSS